MTSEKPPINEGLVSEEALKTAIEAAVSASKHVLTYWPSPSNPLFDKNRVMEILEKEEGTGNYATIADVESEKIIIAVIKNNALFSDHTIVAEESDMESGTSKYKWVIDPIDGTGSFRHGLPDFGINIGLIEGQEPVVGVIAIPALGLLAAARKGHGAKLYDFEGNMVLDLTENAKGLQEKFTDIFVGYDIGYVDRGKHLTNYTAKLADQIGYPVSFGSCASGNFKLAQGSLAAYFLPNPKIFDIAAPAALINELGGKVSGIDGSPIDWNSKDLSYLAARTPELHTQILDILNN